MKALFTIRKQSSYCISFKYKYSNGIHSLKTQTVLEVHSVDLITKLPNMIILYRLLYECVT